MIFGRFLIVILTLSSLCLQALAGEPSLTQSLQSIVSRHQVPALSALRITPSQQDEVTSGVLTAGRTQSANDGAIFHLGSCTKAMTSYLIAHAIERGLLRWEASLLELFPAELSGRPNQVTNITVAELASHTSGLPNGIANYEGGELWNVFWTPGVSATIGRRSALESIARLSPQELLGRTYHYANINYILLGLVIDKVTQQTWEEALQSNIFSPLGMTSCGLGPKPSTAPAPHRVIQNQLTAVMSPAALDNPLAMNSSARVHCSLRDWSKFLAHLMEIKQDGVRDTYDALFEAPEGGNYTYGAWVKLTRRWSNGPVFTHSGSNTMNYAVAWLAPEEQSAYLSATNVANSPDQREVLATDEAIQLLMSLPR